ncbi:hypothetical protein VSDG_09492 [Cytospora chrysosperma]|uniref:Uncharacterized protein n=1 Tax=Cytospora chrysosperma TaxID=252740 RepID=A0A423VCL6_CYTCH|nr:hypothetical protein VSDG_09492 [Valsa sordida]
MTSEKARGKMPAAAAATASISTPSYMMPTNAAETRRTTRSQTKDQRLTGGVFTTAGSVKGIVIQGPGGTVQDHAARLLKKTGSVEAAIASANATVKASAPAGKASGSSNKGLDSRLRARQLLRFLSQSPRPGDDKDDKLEAVRNAIDEIPRGLERLESLVAMSKSTAGAAGDEAEWEPFFEQMTPNKLTAYIRRNLARWLDSLVPLDDDMSRAQGQAGTTASTSSVTTTKATTAAAAVGHEALPDGVVTGGSASIAAPPVADPPLPQSAATPIPPAVAVAVAVVGAAVNPVVGDSNKDDIQASKPSSDGNDGAGIKGAPREASPTPSSASTSREIRLPTSSTTVAAGCHQIQEGEQVQKGTYDFPSLDDGSEAFRFCLIEWEWARRYRVLSYTNFQPVLPSNRGDSIESNSQVIAQYAQWIQKERPVDDHNPVPYWVRNEERERAQRLNLPETKYSTRWLASGIEGLPGGGYGAWRKDSRGRWVRVLASGKCVAPKHGVFDLTGDWNKGKGEE